MSYRLKLSFHKLLMTKQIFRCLFKLRPRRIYYVYITVSSLSYPNRQRRKDVFYEMSSTCTECEMRFTRRDNMKRHFNSRHENMKFIPPPPPKETGYDYTPPPLPPQERYVYTPPPPRSPQLSLLQHETETEEPYFIYSTGDPFVFKVPSGRLPDHCMPWAHPFTSVISGPTGSGKSVFVRRFVHNIHHMRIPSPDRI